MTEVNQKKYQSVWSLEIIDNKERKGLTKVFIRKSRFSLLNLRILQVKKSSLILQSYDLVSVELDKKEPVILVRLELIVKECLWVGHTTVKHIKKTLIWK